MWENSLCDLAVTDPAVVLAGSILVTGSRVILVSVQAIVEGYRHPEDIRMLTRISLDHVFWLITIKEKEVMQQKIGFRLMSSQIRIRGAFNENHN